VTKTSQIRDFATSFFNKKNVTTTAQRSSEEDMKQVIDLAAVFDDIVKRPGYEKLMEFFAKEVNTEITDATMYKFEPARQQVHVIRWDAKRELLDAALAYVSSIQRSRDEIVEQVKKSREQLQDVT